jgi:cell division protein FtsL
MIRITTLLWIALLAVAGGTVMNVSYQVRLVQRHIAELQRDARQEQEAIHILDAEWDTLNDPKRIDGLAQRYLPGLQSTPIARVTTLEDIPLKPSEDQLAKLAVPAPRLVKDHAAAAKKAPLPAPVLKSVSPATPVEVAARSSAGAPARAAVDSIGLILARAERQE